MSGSERSRADSVRYAAVCALLLLLAGGLAWELWLAPLRAGGSWLALKVLPLCLPLSGLLHGRVYTFQYTSLLVLPYFAEAAVRLFDADVLSRWCAGFCLAASLCLFFACLAYVRLLKKGGGQGV